MPNAQLRPYVLRAVVGGVRLSWLPLWPSAFFGVGSHGSQCNYFDLRFKDLRLHRKIIIALLRGIGSVSIEMKTVPVNVRFPKIVDDQLQAEAERRAISKSDVIREVVIKKFPMKVRKPEPATAT